MKTTNSILKNKFIGEEIIVAKEYEDKESQEEAIANNVEEELNLKIPEWTTEEELLSLIETIAKPYCKKYSFPGHTEKDMMQIAIMEGIDGANNFDPEKGTPIKNFISVHLRNRLYNYKRNNYIRLEKPCSKCPVGAYIPPNKCKAYEDKMDCDLYAKWVEKNQIRQNINNAVDFSFGVVDQDNALSVDCIMGDQIDKREFFDYIDENLDIKYRKNYLLFISGSRLSQNLKDELISEISRLWQKKKQEEN